VSINNWVSIQFGDAQATLQAGSLQMILHNNDNDDSLEFSHNEQASKVTVINVLCHCKEKCRNYFTMDQLMELKHKNQFASFHDSILLLIRRNLKTDCFFVVSTYGLDYQGCYLLIKELRAIQLNTPNAGFLIFTTYEVYHRLFQTKTIEVINMDDVMSQLKNLHFFEVKK
jgi:hypothetical protein